MEKIDIYWRCRETLHMSTGKHRNSDYLQIDDAPLTLKDANGNEHDVSEGWEKYFYEIPTPGSIDSFIQGLKSISPEKRRLPLVTNCPNGLQVYPSIKMQTTDFMLGGEVEKMVITWED